MIITIELFTKNSYTDHIYTDGTMDGKNEGKDKSEKEVKTKKVQ